jgi:hypothetical protein
MFDEIRIFIQAHPSGTIASAGALVAAVFGGAAFFDMRSRIASLHSALFAVHDQAAGARYDGAEYVRDLHAIIVQTNKALVAKATALESARLELDTACRRNGEWIAQLSEMTEERDGIQAERDALRSDNEALVDEVQSLTRRLSRPGRKGIKPRPAPLAIAAE